MKYNIEGINDKEVIKAIEIISDKHVKKAIDVIYLDEKKDRVAYNDEIYNRIINIMTEQARKYVSEKDKKIKDLKNDKKAIVWVDIILLILALSSFCASLPIVTTIGSLSLGFVLSIFTPIINNKIKDLEKYAMYLDGFQKDIEEYKEIIAKEEQLGKEKSLAEVFNMNLHDITVLDKYNLKELKEIREKVVRYNKLVGVSSYVAEFNKNNVEQENVKTKVKSRNK